MSSLYGASPAIISGPMSNPFITGSDYSFVTDSAAYYMAYAPTVAGPGQRSAL